PQPVPRQQAAAAAAAAPAPAPPRPVPAEPEPTRLSEASSQPAPIAARVERPELARPQPPVASGQPLQVTESTPVGNPPFALPPPVQRRVDAPRAAVEVPELAQQVQAIEIVEVPSARAVERDIDLPAATVAV